MLFEITKESCYFHIRSKMDQFLASLIPEEESALKVEHLRNLFFGNYMFPDAEVKVYDEVINVLLVFICKIPHFFYYEVH